jgi:hypothetical protein
VLKASRFFVNQTALTGETFPAALHVLITEVPRRISTVG